MQSIPSAITPGKHFNVYVHKPQGRKPYAAAVEVTPTAGGGFTYIPTEARALNAGLTGNNTLANRRKAVATLLAEMVEKEWVTAEVAAGFHIE